MFAVRDLLFFTDLSWSTPPMVDLHLQWTSLVAHMVKCLPTMQDTQVWSLGWEDPLEKEMATHSSTLAWKIPWTEEPGRLQPMGSQRVGPNWVTSLFTPPIIISKLSVILDFCVPHCILFLRMCFPTSCNQILNILSCMDYIYRFPR